MVSVAKGKKEKKVIIGTIAKKKKAGNMKASMVKKGENMKAKVKKGGNMKAKKVKKVGDVKVKEEVLELVEVIENVNGAETIATPKKKKLTMKKKQVTLVKPPVDTNGLENNIAVGKKKIIKKSTSKSPEVTKKKINGVAGKKQKVQKRKLEEGQEIETKTPGKENTTPIKKKQKPNNATTAKGIKFKLQFQKDDMMTKVDGMWMLKTDVEEYTNALPADKKNLKHRMKNRLRKELKKAAGEKYKVAAKEATVPSQMPLTYQDNNFMTQYEGYWVHKTAVSKLERLAEKKTHQLIVARGKGESTRNLTEVEKMKLVKFMRLQKVRYSKRLNLSLARQARKEMKAKISLSFPKLETTSDAEEGEGVVNEKGEVINEKGGVIKEKGGVVNEKGIVKGKETGEGKVKGKGKIVKGKIVKGKGKKAREERETQVLESFLNIDFASDPDITKFMGSYVNKSAIPDLYKLKDKLNDGKLSRPDVRRRLKVAAKQQERAMKSDKIKKLAASK